MVQHYFVSAWVPREVIGNTYRGRKLKDQDIYLFGLTTPPVTIAPERQGPLEPAFMPGRKTSTDLKR